MLKYKGKIIYMNLKYSGVFVNTYLFRYENIFAKLMRIQAIVPLSSSFAEFATSF
jgi:hypothetical protein